MPSRYTEAQKNFMDAAMGTALSQKGPMEPLDLMIQLSRRRRECTPSIPLETIHDYVDELIRTGKLVPTDRETTYSRERYKLASI